MIILLCLVLGAALGAWRAKRREGGRLDMAQWAAVHAIALGLAGLVVTVVLARMT